MIDIRVKRRQAYKPKLMKYNNITGGSNEESMIPEIDQPKQHKKEPKTSLFNRIKAYIIRLFT